MEFAARGQRTVMARAEHCGPLRVQRPFHPEPDGACHVYVLHPPGGVVGGDLLNLQVSGQGNGRALVTTPGATKLYRSRGPEASVCQAFDVSAGFCVEWLPQESIAFAGTRTRIQTCVRLAQGATYAGWEVLCLGRPAAGERFTSGRLQIEQRIEREGRLRWLERGLLVGGERVLEAAWGLGGHAVLGTFVVAPAQEPQDSWVEAVREAVFGGEQDELAVTVVSGVFVARYLGPHVHRATELFRKIWQILRPYYAGARAVVPRIWHT